MSMKHRLSHFIYCLLILWPIVGIFYLFRCYDKYINGVESKSGQSLGSRAGLKNKIKYLFRGQTHYAAVMSSHRSLFPLQEHRAIHSFNVINSAERECEFHSRLNEEALLSTGLFRELYIVQQDLREVTQ